MLPEAQWPPNGAAGSAICGAPPAAPVQILHHFGGHYVLRRERAPHPLPRTTVELVGPDTLTGGKVAAIWASVLRRPVHHGGDDLDVFEQQAATMLPGWMARDMRMMFRALPPIRDGSGHQQPRDAGGADRASAADLSRLRERGGPGLVSSSS